MQCKRILKNNFSVFLALQKVQKYGRFTHYRFGTYHNSNPMRIQDSITTNRIPIIIILFMHCIAAAAQVALVVPEPTFRGDTVWVSGYAVDMLSRTHLLNIKVEASLGDSVVASAHTMDHARQYGYPAEAFSKKMDYYGMALPRPGNYELEFSGQGYDTLRIQIRIPARQYGRRVKTWSVEDAVMQRMKTTRLSELTVKASKIKMVMRGDTIVYDADAFNLAEGSMLDALVRQLPGVELRKDGRIYVNGRYVESLLIDGRNFFAGDAGIALENLPSYVVDKVKVYEKDHDWAYLRSTRDTVLKDRLPLVMDVRLKRQYKIGWIGNAEAAGGTSERYLGRLFGMRHTTHSRISLYAAADNVNDTRTPGSSGEWTPSEQASGRQEQQRAGVDFHVDGSRHPVSYDATLTGAHRKADIRTFTSATTFLPGSDNYQRIRAQQDNRLTSLSIKQKVSLPHKDFHLNFQPDISVSHSENHTGTVSAQFSQDPADSYRGASLDSLYAAEGSERLERILVNKFNQQGHYESDRLNAKGVIALRTRSHWTGNNITAGINGDYDRKSARDFTCYDLQYDGGRDFRNQYDPSKAMHYLYGGILQYEAAFSKVKTMLVYSYEQKFDSGDRLLYRLDSLDGWGAATEEPFGSLPSATGWEQKAIDHRNSSHATELNREQYLHANADVALGKKAGTLRLALWGIWHNDRRRDLRVPTLYHARRRKFFLDPLIEYKRGRLSMSYRLSHSLPSMGYMLDIRDDSDPQRIFLGNSGLKAGYSHEAQASYLKLSAARIWNVMVSYKTLENAVSQCMTYNARTGVYTYRPENVDGNWNLSLISGQMFRLGEGRRWQIEGNTDLNVSHNVDYVEEQVSQSSVRSLVQRVDVGEKVKAMYKGETMSAGVSAGVSGIFMGSPRPGFEDIRAADIQYGVTCSTRLPWQLFLETDLTMYHRRGYADHSMNTNDLVWNASLSRAIGKGKRWSVKATGFDLLHQLSNVRQQVNAQGRTETWHNTLPSYAMLHLKYMLDIKPKEK